ncbi:MAG: ATP synthase F1 subunit delta [Alphaproteobacteria bacterium]|nr:ATP synthase F1 subunit delta [Alphaproteobacteria bacterium]
MSEHLDVALPVAGEHAILARRYAKALFALAEQDKAVDAVAADMLALRHLWDESPEWRLVASDPRFGIEMVGRAVAQVAKITGVNKLTANFLAIVAQNRRLSLLPIMVKDFFEEADARRGLFRAAVRTARSLSEAQMASLSASLSAVVGGKIRLSVVEDASIIGGLTVKLGSQFIDASVKTKLDHLERTLKGAGAAA